MPKSGMDLLDKRLGRERVTRIHFMAHEQSGTVVRVLESIVGCTILRKV